MKSAVLIIPAALQDEANAFCAAMGWQQPGAVPGMFCAAVTATGHAITHYACRPDVTLSILQTIGQACGYPDPAAWAGAMWENDPLVPPPAPSGDIAPLFAALIMDVSQSGEWGAAHFARVLAEHGLEVWNGN